VPVDRLRQDAASQQADRTAARDDERVDAHRDRALGRLRELGDQQRQNRGRGDGPAEALHEPGHDQQDLIICQAADHRRQREGDQSGQEHPLAPEQVSQPPGEQQEATERDHVRIDDPGQVGLREAEVALHRGQGHVHDRGVEHHHQLTEANHSEGDPPPAFPID
jgi:hypothetical protein